MRRAVALILVLCYAVLGTGLVQHLHRLQHDAAPVGMHDKDHHPPTQGNLPADDHCSLCLLLHQPFMAQHIVPSLVVIFAHSGDCTPESMAMVETIRVDRIDCRGPPERLPLV